MASATAKLACLLIKICFVRGVVVSGVYRKARLELTGLGVFSNPELSSFR